MENIYNTQNLKVKIILGSTRKNRISELVGQWVFDELTTRPGFEVEILDLLEYPLPFFEEPASPRMSPEPYTNPAAVRLKEKIAEGDVFVIVAPEYNHGYSAVLKNALDYIDAEWHRKPVGFVSYGSQGGARAVEQLRLVAIELHMAPIPAAIHIAEPWNVISSKQAEAAYTREYTQERIHTFIDVSHRLHDIPGYAHAAEVFAQDLLWWGKALHAARTTPLNQG